MNTRMSNRPAALPHRTAMSPLRGIVYWLVRRLCLLKRSSALSGT